MLNTPQGAPLTGLEMGVWQYKCFCTILGIAWYQWKYTQFIFKYLIPYFCKAKIKGWNRRIEIFVLYIPVNYMLVWTNGITVCP